MISMFENKNYLVEAIGLSFSYECTERYRVHKNKKISEGGGRGRGQASYFNQVAKEFCALEHMFSGHAIFT